MPPVARTRALTSLVLPLALALSACSPRRAVEWVLLGHSFELTRDLAYGPDPRQRLDVYRPRQGTRGMPVVVFLYGGRWQGGSRELYHLLGDAFAREGVLAVVPDYRLAPQVSFPGWVEDAARVVRWVHDSIARFGGDPGRTFVVGHSAGAHTAMLLALDPHYLRAAGVPPGAVHGYAGLAGPVATTWTDPDVQALMGPRERWAATYPLTYARGDAAPILLLHGGGDRTVNPANAARLASAIRARGGCASSKVYRGLDHIGIAVALSVPRLRLAPVMDDLLGFMRDPRGVACAR